MTKRTAFASLQKPLLVTSCFAVMSAVVAAQIPLSEVEVRVERTLGGAGCLGPCTRIMGWQVVRTGQLS